MLIEWNSEYSVEVEEIDMQHKKIFVLIDELNTAINDMKTKESLEKILSGLVNYAIYHFDTEEKYFDQFHYEFTDEHKEQHEIFKKKVTDISQKIDKNEIEISSELIDYLEDWILEHVTDSDQKYKKCLKENGLK